MVLDQSGTVPIYCNPSPSFLFGVLVHACEPSTWAKRLKFRASLGYLARQPQNKDNREGRKGGRALHRVGVVALLGI